MTVRYLNYFNDGTTGIDTATIKRILFENGTARGDPLVPVIDLAGNDRSGDNISDDFENYPVPAYDLARITNVNSPWTCIPNNAATFMAQAAGTIKSGLKCMVVDSPNGTGRTAKYLINEYVFVDDIKKYTYEVWFYDLTYNASNPNWLFQASLFNSGIYLRRDWNAGTYSCSVGGLVMPIPKVRPTFATWVGFKIVHEGDFVKFYIFDPSQDSDWDLVITAPGAVTYEDEFGIAFNNTAAGPQTGYVDFFNLHTNIDYEIGDFMLFEFDTSDIGSADTIWDYAQLTFDQLNASAGTDTTVVFDIYGWQGAAWNLRASGIIVSPTDLKDIVDAADTKIKVKCRFNAPASQSSPQLTKLQIAYQEPPTVTVTNPPGAAATDVGAVFVAEMTGTDDANNVPRLTVTEFYVDWGDGSNSGWTTASKIPYVYDSNLGSPLTLSAKCRDSEGTESAVVTRAITIGTVDPICTPRVFPPQGTTAVTSIKVDQTESYEPNQNDTIATYGVDWGEGAGWLDDINAIKTNTFATAGIYKTQHRCTNTAAVLTSDVKDVYVTIEDTPTPVDLTFADLYGTEIGPVEASFGNVADMIAEKVIDEEWTKYEDQDDKTRILRFKVKLSNLEGQNFRDNIYTYFENRTLLRVNWQPRDFGGTLDPRYFTGRIIALPHELPPAAQPEIMTVTMIREG